jgi:hypothetical protein
MSLLPLRGFSLSPRHTYVCMYLFIVLFLNDLVSNCFIVLHREREKAARKLSESFKDNTDVVLPIWSQEERELLMKEMARNNLRR